MREDAAAEDCRLGLLLLIIISFMRARFTQCRASHYFSTAFGSHIFIGEELAYSVINRF